MRGDWGPNGELTHRVHGHHFQMLCEPLLWKTDAQLLYMVLLIQIESNVNMILPPGYLTHFWM